jgi:hypothetical protein
MTQKTNPESPTSCSDLTSTPNQFRDAPLTQLLGTPLHDLSPEELREFVAVCRTKRTSPQTFKAAIVEESDVLVKRVRKGKTKAVDLNDLLSDL